MLVLPWAEEGNAMGKPCPLGSGVSGYILLSPTHRADDPEADSSSGGSSGTKPLLFTVATNLVVHPCAGFPVPSVTLFPSSTPFLK